jgi:catechol 2,3-dioxygenase-like lactoylglutathione lyase family enzyme
MIRSLAQVGVTCSDFQRSLKFYGEILGLPCLAVIDVPEDQVRDIYGIDPAKNKVTLALMRTGNGGFVELFRFEPLHGEHQKVVWERPGITHFSFNVKNLAAARKRLEAAGYKFVTPVKTNMGTDFIFLRDPDGNLIELLDMKLLYWPGQWLGGLMARMNMRGKYKELISKVKY